MFLWEQFFKMPLQSRNETVDLSNRSSSGEFRGIRAGMDRARECRRSQLVHQRWPTAVVASLKCCQKLEAYDGQEDQLADEKGIA